MPTGLWLASFHQRFGLGGRRAVDDVSTTREVETANLLVLELRARTISRASVMLR